jgi:hypothetical protein
LSGTAENVRAAIGYLFLPADRLAHEQGLAALRESLGPEAFERAWADGEAMSLDEAVAYALKREP